MADGTTSPSQSVHQLLALAHAHRMTRGAVAPWLRVRDSHHIRACKIPASRDAGTQQEDQRVQLQLVAHSRL